MRSTAFEGSAVGGLVRAHRTVCAAERLGVDRVRRVVALDPPRCPDGLSPAGATTRSSVTTGDWFTRSPEV